MKNRIWSLIIILVLLFSVAGCNASINNTSDGGYVKGDFLMVIDKANNKLVKVPYTFKTETVREQIDEVIDAFINYYSTTYSSPISSESSYLYYDLNEKNVQIFFTEDYYKLQITDEVLVRAAIVSTICQFNAIDDVSFFVGESELTIQNKVVGRMNAESFLLDVKATEEKKKVILYFPDDNYEYLHKVERYVTYEKMYTDEQIVFEELLKGPGQEGLTQAIPDNTELITIVTKNMVCYVNLSSEFNIYNEQVPDTMTIFSIVNSLYELPGVSSIILSVDGEQLINYRTFECGDSITFNYDVLAPEE